MTSSQTFHEQITCTNKTMQVINGTNVGGHKLALNSLHSHDLNLGRNHHQSHYNIFYDL